MMNFLPGLRLSWWLTAGGLRRPPVPEAKTAARAATLLVPIGFVIGMIYAQLYSWVWGLFGELQGLRIMPALAVTLLAAGWLDARMFTGLAQTAELLVAERPRRDDLRRPAPLGPTGVLVLVLAMLVLFAGLLSAPPPPPYWWPDDWRRYFMWTLPPSLLRLVACLPLWSRFGVMLAASIGPPARLADPATAEFCRQNRLTRTLAWAVVPFGLTTYWFTAWPGRLYGPAIALGTFVMIFLAAVLIVRRTRGHTRATLEACGAVGALSFLILFLSVAQPMTWTP
jgi:cobalamin synthase